MDAHYRAKLDRLIAGSREIVGEEFMEAIVDDDASNMVRTCRNRQRCGIHDPFVAWIVDSAAPVDLEFKTGYAIGSK